MNSARFYVFLHVSLFNFKAKIKGDFFYRMILLEVFEFFCKFRKKDEISVLDVVFLTDRY